MIGSKTFYAPIQSALEGWNHQWLEPICRELNSYRINITIMYYIFTPPSSPPAQGVFL